MTPASDAPDRQFVMVMLGRLTLVAAAVVAGVAVPHAQDRADPARSWQAAWEARQGQEGERRHAERIRRDYERRRAAAHARMRANPDTAYPSLPPPADSMCPVYADPEARREFLRQDRRRREEAFRRTTGLPLQTGYSVHAVPKRSRNTFAASGSLAMTASPHAASTAVAAASTAVAAASTSSTSEPGHMVPLFPSASDESGRQGFARVVNHSDEAGEATIEAFDDEGTSYGPLTLSIDARETVHFNSADLEGGNAGKGLTGGTGPGQGDWRLEVDSDLDIEVLSYIRTTDGFLTAMHDTAPTEDGRHEVAVFNPGSNQNQESRLRLVNRSDGEATAMIAGVDDKGASPGEGATVTIPGYASRTYTAAQLEGGGAAGLTGSIGDGAGKWRLVVESDQEIVAMNLLSSPTGHLTNLSTAPDNEADGTRSVPLFPSAADADGRQGFVRVVNRSDEAGEVTIRAFDDTDVEYETLTLAIGAKEAVHFNSDDLELGNAGKGLAGSTGAGDGDWRLEFTSELDIRVLSYIRTEDGFLTCMHDTVPRSAKRHRVAVFNPGSNRNQESRLRLVNPGDGDAEVTIGGFDGRGESPGSDVVVDVPAGGSVTLTAQDLEAGSPDFEGALGDGAGKWSLTVTADRAIMAMSLLSSPTGHLTNLSTAPQRGAGPVETASEAFEALISPVIQSDCSNCHVEGGQSGHTPLVFVKETDGDHLAKNLKVFEDYVATEEDGAAVILDKIKGARGHHGGVRFATGTDEYRGFERFMELLGAEVEQPAFADLFESVTLESSRRTLWRAAIVFAGRIPKDKEYAAVEGGTDNDLRRTIRELMEGPEFHEFLIRGSNDRLLTDRGLGSEVIPRGTLFVDYTNKLFRLIESAGGDVEAPQAWNWVGDVQYGASRAPLELIAHVADNDLDYRKILTADFIMANPMAAEAYGAETEFADPDDVHEFKPSEIVSYYRDDDSKKWRTAYEKFDIIEVTDPGNLWTDYPHAGILNTTAFLLRYPSTATNRNRARSRWTYYHFLGFDIEKSKLRTMDAEVLKDRNNPTMHNPACTGCHERMDPVAGAFQNYGDGGMYRDQYGGFDSLDPFYKDGGGNPVFRLIAARTWEERETVSVEAWLAAGSRTVGLATRSSHNIHVDYLAVRNAEGFETRQELEDSDDRECGSVWTGNTYELIHCPLVVDVEVPVTGMYVVETAAYVGYDYDEVPGNPGKLAIWAPYDEHYRKGDTWYRDMREPGFVREPDLVVARVPADRTDNSLQWLAERLVEEGRFAEAAVKFWWPSVMGSEVVEQPLETDDPDYESWTSAADAQAVEVRRLADGFREGHGWSDGNPYNLKDLLVEMVMSSWFRAESLPDDDPARDAFRIAQAGARRLLTPEELALKTAAVTGFQWGRIRAHETLRKQPERTLSALTDRDGGYRMLYGGIDSDGVTERARHLSSTMAGVAQSHAVESSCPIVLREWYLLPEDRRRLFGEVDPLVSPVYEFSDDFEIEAESSSDPDELSLQGHLPQGTVEVVLTYTNDYSGEDGDRNVRLDRLDLVDETGELVERHELEELEGRGHCYGPVGDAYGLDCNGSIKVSAEVASAGIYRVNVTAWAEQAGDELARLDVVVGSNNRSSAGSARIREQLVDLYGKLTGLQLSTDSPEVQAAYALFVDVWERKRDVAEAHFLWNDEGLICRWEIDERYFEEIEDELWVDERGWDTDAAGAYLADADLSDPQAMARTWTVVLAYLLMDYRYLYL